jgi:hypothetical protein
MESPDGQAEDERLSLGGLATFLLHKSSKIV